LVGSVFKKQQAAAMGLFAGAGQRPVRRKEEQPEARLSFLFVFAGRLYLFGSNNVRARAHRHRLRHPFDWFAVGLR
jgi:hypothetical protein